MAAVARVRATCQLDLVQIDALIATGMADVMTLDNLYYYTNIIGHVAALLTLRGEFD
jgi:hypothetical protein